jgi:hypothetical protein
MAAKRAQSITKIRQVLYSVYRYYTIQYSWSTTTRESRTALKKQAGTGGCLREEQSTSKTVNAICSLVYTPVVLVLHQHSTGPYS